MTENQTTSEHIKMDSSKHLPSLIHRINSELPLLAIDCDDKMHLWSWTYHCIESDMFESWEEALTDWMSWAVKNLNAPDGIDSPQGRETILAVLMTMIEGLEDQSKEDSEETVVDTFDPSSLGLDESMSRQTKDCDGNEGLEIWTRVKASEARICNGKFRGYGHNNGGLAPDGRPECLEIEFIPDDRNIASKISTTSIYCWHSEAETPDPTSFIEGKTLEQDFAESNSPRNLKMGETLTRETINGTETWTKIKAYEAKNWDGELAGYKPGTPEGERECLEKKFIPDDEDELIRFTNYW